MTLFLLLFFDICYQTRTPIFRCWKQLSYLQEFLFLIVDIAIQQMTDADYGLDTGRGTK